jgi:hypothetical protein
LRESQRREGVRDMNYMPVDSTNIIFDIKHSTNLKSQNVYRRILATQPSNSIIQIRRVKTRAKKRLFVPPCCCQAEIRP